MAPVTVSDLTAHLVVGFEPRHFREFLRAAKVPHAVLGRRVVARVEDVLAAIDRLASSDAPAPVDCTPSESEPSADELLARIGRVRGRS